MSNSHAGPVLMRFGRGDDDDDCHELGAVAAVPSDVLIDTNHHDDLERDHLIDQAPPALDDDGGIRRMPGFTQASGDATDNEVVQVESDQRPTERALGQLQAGIRRCGDLFGPAMYAVPAAVLGGL